MCGAKVIHAEAFKCDDSVRSDEDDMARNAIRWFEELLSTVETSMNYLVDNHVFHLNLS